jgi:hypothetical protein
MKPLQRYRAMEAFCRQRSKMEGEDELFWLTEAEVLAKLATNAHRMQVLKIPSPDIANIKGLFELKALYSQQLIKLIRSGIVRLRFFRPEGAKMNFSTLHGKKSRFARNVIPIVLLLISHSAAQSGTIQTDQIRDYFFYQQGFAPWGINSNSTSVGVEINLFPSSLGPNASFAAEAPFASQTTVTATGGGATFNIPYWNAPAQPTNFSSLPLNTSLTQPFTITVSSPGFQPATFQTQGLNTLPANFPSVAFITNVATSNFSTTPTISWLQPAHGHQVATAKLPCIPLTQRVLLGDEKWTNDRTVRHSK